MGKPLLTDDIIRQYQSEKNNFQKKNVTPPSSLTEDYLADFDSDNNHVNSQKMVKSRRIENAKRLAFGKKLNVVLMIIVLLLMFLIYAIFTF